MPSIRETAKLRLANLKKTGGFPEVKPKGSLLGNDAKQIKIRKGYEDMEEGFKRGGK